MIKKKKPKKINYFNKELIKFKEIVNKINNLTFTQKEISKKANLRKKEFEEHKNKSLEISIIISLFIMFAITLFSNNLIYSIGISFLIFCIIFILILNIPTIKQKKYTKEIENEMPNFLTNLITELRVGKPLFDSIKSCSKGKIGEEYLLVLRNVNQGVSFQDAISQMNLKFNSLLIKRTNSNLVNIYSHGNNTYSLKKFNDELLMRQRIESKEFGGKMVVYALVFIAISAIMPAMFISFILIGSYFMKIAFSSIQIFVIITIIFPILNSLVLLLINSKTPQFLRSK